MDFSTDLFQYPLKEVILASVDLVLRRVSTLGYKFNWSKINFGEIHIYQGLDWAFPSLSPIIFSC